MGVRTFSSAFSTVSAQAATVPLVVLHFAGFCGGAGQFTDPLVFRRCFRGISTLLSALWFPAGALLAAFVSGHTICHFAYGVTPCRFRRRREAFLRLGVFTYGLGAGAAVFL